jgi:hypothetical protein
VSATNRSDVRDELDRYDTPAWCVHRLLEAVDIPVGRWLEPSAGSGAIRAAVERQPYGGWIQWTEMDIAPRRAGIVEQDFLAAKFEHTYAGLPFRCAIGNPPYRLAEDFARRCVGVADVTVFLLRLNWLAGAKRADWMQRNTPSIYVLPNRPSFTGGGTDATDYAWFVWRKGVTPEVKILATTPASERRSP